MEYGVNARVGGIPVFSREGAITAYKTFCKACHENLNEETSSALSKVTDQMVKELGFSYEECENFEIEVLQEMK